MATTSTNLPPTQADALSARPDGHGEALREEPRWQVRLLAAVEAFDGLRRIERFPARAMAALLARLALAPARAHSREELVELLWPGVALAVGRNRLRQTLSTLKSLLEPPDRPGTGVLLADRLHVRVVPGALGCDARSFEQLLQARRTLEARALYGGELMPVFYDEWIDDERSRLAAQYVQLDAQPPLTDSARAAQRVPASGRRGEARTASGATVRPDEPCTPLLPAYLARWFGADRAAARLRSQVLSHRLASLLGPGGSGKTRLAVEVATVLRADSG